FQAEDGIRDRTVTGVQTCALPIFRLIRLTFAAPSAAILSCLNASPGVTASPSKASRKLPARPSALNLALASGLDAAPGSTVMDEIGRASCRERVESSEGAGSIARV